MKGAIASNLPMISLLADIPARNDFYKDGKLNNFNMNDYTDKNEIIINLHPYYNNNLQ